MIFNHVSKYDDPAKALERIEKYRSLLLEKAQEIYCCVISDSTELESQKWKDIKKQVLDSSEQEEEWFKSLS